MHRSGRCDAKRSGYALSTMRLDERRPISLLQDLRHAACDTGFRTRTRGSGSPAQNQAHNAHGASSRNPSVPATSGNPRSKDAAPQGHDYTHATSVSSRSAGPCCNSEHACVRRKRPVSGGNPARKSFEPGPPHGSTRARPREQRSVSGGYPARSPANPRLPRKRLG